jgi:acetate kinase
MNVPDIEVPPVFDLPTGQPSSSVRPTSALLVLNTGARRLRFSVFKEGIEDALLSGHIEGLDSGALVLRVGSRAPQRLPTPMPYTDPLDIAMNALRKGLPGRLVLRAVVHRVVHGGESFVEPTVLDDDALVDLNRLAALAPLHQMHNLAGIRAARRQWPTLPQIGCFDTAFHATLPELERRLALPESLDDQGVRRHGFHGLSYEHVVRSLRQETERIEGRALLAHIGRGASVCATAGGRSVGTSMGFSSLDGLMMGTRCGSLDAGVVLHLLRQGWSLEQLEHLLYRESGLLGVSGLSEDLQVLRASPTPQSRLAIDLFVHRAVREAGGLITLLGGIDLLAFTGSVGVRDGNMRAAWVRRLSFLGLELDGRANATDCGNEPLPLHRPGSAVEVWVVPCDIGGAAAASAWERLALDAADCGAKEAEAALQPA